jgi:hypothetical protein
MALINNTINIKENQRQSLLNIHPSEALANSVKDFLKFMEGKEDQQDLNKEIEKLRLIYVTMEFKFKLIKEKTIIFGNNVISRINFFINKTTVQILAIYCTYRIIITIKNLLFQNYNDINIMLKDQVLNFIDFSLNIVFKVMNLEIETIYYTVIEQYFSLFIVGIIIITNIRSFLLTILFIYTKTIKKCSSIISKKIQLIFLSYFVGVFYVTSSIFLIFNLPITYR